MPQLPWYWNRLRAMEPGELPKHLRRNFWQMRNADSRKWSLGLNNPHRFPRLPEPSAAPEPLRKALHDADQILAGRWRAFGALPLKVDGPPRWHKDYLAGVDLATTRPARELDHRHLPQGADIKLIWELSRWNQLVRLAQAAYVLNHELAGRKCIDWLKDWMQHNPPFRGWNWTSALESGLRLIQFTWMDALLSKAADLSSHLEALRQAILPPHAEFTWRCRTFGSSANNHLIGELAGLIVATARWPDLERCAAPLLRLQAGLETEILAQFSEDGGNKEQALNYQLFSWELCWQARAALLSASRPLNPVVEERLDRAARFFLEVQVPNDPWDYGDSDNACVMPDFSGSAFREWIQGEGTACEFWLGPPPSLRQGRTGILPVFPHADACGDWWVYSKSGIAICKSGSWFLRLDLSPLGYLKPAAHGHFDAQHLSVWYEDVALVIDPGTGAYYGQPALRSWLASRHAHNGPCLDSADAPKRLGPFLWSQHHPAPQWRGRKSGIESELTLGPDRALRSISRADDGEGWQIVDSFVREDQSPWSFTVRWQFAPDTFIKVLGERRFQLNRRAVAIIVDVDPTWAGVRLVERESDRPPDEPPLAGIVSPSFRQTVFAPYLLLTAVSSDKPCVFRTTFLACEAQ